MADLNKKWVRKDKQVEILYAIRKQRQEAQKYKKKWMKDHFKETVKLKIWILKQDDKF